MKPIQFQLAGHEITEPRLYDICGLANVFLLNGYEVIRRDDEEYVSVTDVTGLHNAISKHIVLKHKVLSPSEVRFIRKALNFTQSEMAGKLGVNVQSVARWEKGQCEMPATADKLLRAVFLAQNLSEDEDLHMLRRLLTTIMDELDMIDEREPPQASFRLEDTWTEVKLGNAA